MNTRREQDPTPKPDPLLLYTTPSQRTGASFLLVSSVGTARRLAATPVTRSRARARSLAVQPLASRISPAISLARSTLLLGSALALVEVERVALGVVAERRLPRRLPPPRTRPSAAPPPRHDLLRHRLPPQLRPCGPLMRDAPRLLGAGLAAQRSVLQPPGGRRPRQRPPGVGLYPFESEPS